MCLGTQVRTGQSPQLYFLFLPPSLCVQDLRPDQERDRSKKTCRGPHLGTGGLSAGAGGGGGAELLQQGGGLKNPNVDGTEPQDGANNKFY